MKKFSFKIRFLTPAFLGDAEQACRWRTPPFKALLRQFWRMAYAADHKFRVPLDNMRTDEGLLFGNAWLTIQEGGKSKAAFTKSLVRIRLDSWERGEETKATWGKKDRQTKLKHPEVETPIGALLYLGYGPLATQREEEKGVTNWVTVLNRHCAIRAEEVARFTIAVPDGDERPALNELLERNIPRIEQALYLMHLYGTVGGRSRNGWGSFVLEPVEGTAPLTGQPPLREWRKALGLDWPHALGADEQNRPLIWQTEQTYTDWEEVLRDLARIKLGFRTQLQLSGTIPRDVPDRCWLGYPIPKRPVKGWDKSARLPNSLRFKVRPAPDDPQKLVGVIFHVPCKPPEKFEPNVPSLVDTWKTVHQFLNELLKLPKQRTFAWLADNQRNQLKDLVKSVTLKRIQE